MNLEAWLRQDHSLSDQLKVIEGLCRALNEAHARGVVHRSLEPANLEVDSDGRCQLGSAVTGSSAPPYRAPELAEGGGPSPQSDIYSAGVICYEMLSGRTPSGERPTALADLRPDVSRDLTDAVMGCLEKGPDWRPKDLSYLLQVVGTMRPGGSKGGGRAAPRGAEPSRSAPKSAAAPPRRAPARGGSKSNLPLVAAVGVLALAAGAGYWLYFKQSGTESPVGSSGPPPTLLRTPPPVVEATPTPVAVATPKVVETPRPGATPTPAATPVATPNPRVAVTVATPEPVATPTPAAVVATPPPTPPPTTAPAEPALLTAVSPLTVRRGGTTMLDLRGSGLRPDHQARLVKVKENTDGISVARQKYMDPTLIRVLLNLDPNVPPGAYAIALSDGGGGMTNTLPFTVVK
ncbi:MAG: serine/threonine protein kinase [Candidatus Methylomirabilales bacterium]